MGFFSNTAFGAALLNSLDGCGWLPLARLCCFVLLSSKVLILNDGVDLYNPRSVTPNSLMDLVGSVKSALLLCIQDYAIQVLAQGRN